MKITNNTQETDHFFKQALLNPQKNELLYVLDSCCKIVSEKNLRVLHKRILTETLKSLHAKKGAIYFLENENIFRMLESDGITEQEAPQWKNISENVKNELKVNSKAFYEINEDRTVNTKSLLLPIHYNGKLYGIVQVKNRRILESFPKTDVSVAIQLMEFIDIAISNAKTSTQTKHSTLRLHNKKTLAANYFHEFFSIELKRAKRYSKTFSIIYLVIENLDDIKRALSEEIADKFVNNLLDKANGVIRETDFIVEEADNKYFIMLPETDYFGSLITLRKLDSFIAGAIVESDSADMSVLIRMTSVSFPKDGETQRELFGSLSARVKGARGSIIDKVKGKSKNFWEILTDLLGDENNYSYENDTGKLTDIRTAFTDIQDEKGVTRYAVFHPTIIKRIESILLNETALSSERRGILYIGTPEPANIFNVLKELPDFERSSARFFLITSQCEKVLTFPNLTYIFASDNFLPEHYFIIYLNEEYAYGLLAIKGSNGNFLGIHTSDSAFLESLILKLQNQYLLQEQL